MGQYWVEAARGSQEAGWADHQNFSGDLTKVDQILRYVAEILINC